MLITIHGVMLDYHCNSWSKAFSYMLMLHMELGFMLIHLHGVKIYAHFSTWCEA